MRLFCNPQFGYIRPLVFAGLLFLIGLVWAGAVHWSAERAVARKQAALIAAVESRSQRKLRHLISTEYRDRWGFDREDVIASILDVGGQFFVLVVTPSETGCLFEKRAATASAKLEIQGSGSPIAHQAMRVANRLKEPFLFSWRKESAWPGDWKLRQIENRDLPGDLYGYEPGDIGAAMRDF